MSPRRRSGGGGGGREAARRGLPWDEVYPTLDLHGETGESARQRADRWLRDERLHGSRVVRLVTGKGLHSVGPPVLPAAIAELLRRLKGSVVASWEMEPGGGAYRVELRRPDRRSASHPPPVGDRAPADVPSSAARAGDAELLRRAEESLAELGITPTPALLRAEMLRLRGDRG